MAYSLSNKCAKNCCKRSVVVQPIVEDVVTITCFWNTVYYYYYYYYHTWQLVADQSERGP